MEGLSKNWRPYLQWWLQPPNKMGLWLACAWGKHFCVERPDVFNWKNEVTLQYDSIQTEISPKFRHLHKLAPDLWLKWRILNTSPSRLSQLKENHVLYDLLLQYGFRMYIVLLDIHVRYGCSFQKSHSTTGENRRLSRTRVLQLSRNFSGALET